MRHLWTCSGVRPRLFYHYFIHCDLHFTVLLCVTYSPHSYRLLTISGIKAPFWNRLRLSLRLGIPSDMFKCLCEVFLPLLNLLWLIFHCLTLCGYSTNILTGYDTFLASRLHLTQGKAISKIWDTYRHV